MNFPESAKLNLFVLGLATYCPSLAHVTIITKIFHNSLDEGTILILHQEKDALNWVGGGGFKKLDIIFSIL